MDRLDEELEKEETKTFQRDDLGEGDYLDEEIELDFTETGSARIEPAKYHATIVDCRRGVSPSTKTPYLEMEFLLSDGRTHKERYYTTALAMFRLAKVLQAIGCPYTERASFRPRMVIDKRCVIEIGTRKNDSDGKVFNEVIEVLAPKVAKVAGEAPAAPPAAPETVPAPEAPAQ